MKRKEAINVTILKLKTFSAIASLFLLVSVGRADDEIAQTPNGRYVVVLDGDRVFTVDLNTEQRWRWEFNQPKEEGGNSLIKGGMQVVNDSVVLLQTYGSEATALFNIFTGAKLQSFKDACLVSRDRKSFFAITSTNVTQLDLSGTTTYSTAILGMPGKSVDIEKCDVSSNGLRIAVAYKHDEKCVTVFELPSGKLLSSFECGDDDEALSYLSLSPNGKLLVIGEGGDKATLYDVESSEKKGEFEKDEDNNRVNFENAKFTSNSQSVILSSMYKFYELSAENLEALYHTVVGTQQTFRTVDQYGYTTSSDTYVESEFRWGNFNFTSDNNHILIFRIPFGSGLSPIVSRIILNGVEKERIIHYR